MYLTEFSFSVNKDKTRTNTKNVQITSLKSFYVLLYFFCLILVEYYKVVDL